MEPILRAEKLTKQFGELTANREIDIEIHAGEIHAIAGENGAGKSTLMKMLYGVYQPTAGNLYIDGEKWSAESRRLPGRRASEWCFRISARSCFHSSGKCIPFPPFCRVEDQ